MDERHVHRLWIPHRIFRFLYRAGDAVDLHQRICTFGVWPEGGKARLRSHWLCGNLLGTLLGILDTSREQLVWTNVGVVLDPVFFKWRGFTSCHALSYLGTVPDQCGDGLRGHCEVLV